MRKLYIRFLILIFVLTLSGCNEIPVIDSSVLPSTENAVFTDEGRLFVVGGNFLYEIIKQSDETFNAEILLDCVVEKGPCSFGGLTVDGNVLYAACSVKASEAVEGIDSSPDSVKEQLNLAKESDFNLSMLILNLFGFSAPAATLLYRIDTTDTTDPEISHVPLYSDNEIFHGNGMAVDDYGDIYITNSLALVKEEPSVIKISVENTDLFTISKQAWMAESHGIYPNGIQIEGNIVYYTGGNNLYSIKINDDEERSAGDPNQLYTTPFLNLIDDFAVLPDRVVVTQFSFLGLLSPDTAQGSKLVMLSKQEGQVQSDILNQIYLKSGFIPSSVAHVKGDIFEKNAIFVTSFFTGALYKFSEY